MDATNRQRPAPLLKYERFTPTLRTHYEQEMQAMLEKKLTGVQRWIWLFPAIGGIAFAVFSAIMAWSMPSNFPWLGRLGLALGIPFGLGWSILGARIFRRASLNLRTDTALATGLTWTFLVFLVTIFMVAAPNNIVGLRMIVSGLVFLVGGAVFLIRHVIEQSELRSREKLLEIELHLAELSESLKARTP
jgi:hypothetical protein